MSYKRVGEFFFYFETLVFIIKLFYILIWFIQLKKNNILFQYFSPAQVESDQKDIIIAQLKADIFEMRKNEEDYLSLQDELRKLEHKYRIA